MRSLNLLLSISIILLFSNFNAYSQINLVDAQFFQNRYLSSPAFAGFEVGTRVNLGYRNQWSMFPGAPVDQNLTLDHGFGKVGVGLSVISNKAGDLSNTKLIGTYSYALPINEEGTKLRVGFNFGFQGTNFNAQNVVGDPNDKNIASLNERKSIIDGDFGIAFVTNRLTIDGTIYNLKSQIVGDGSNLDIGTDFNLYFVGAAYSIPMQNWTVNTRMAFRKVKNFDNLVDVGAEVRTSGNQLGFTGIYHSNKSSTFGVSYLHNEKWQVLGMYNTTANPIESYANGSFEVCLQINLKNIKEK